jgi:hypothetical protein
MHKKLPDLTEYASKLHLNGLLLALYGGNITTNMVIASGKLGLLNKTQQLHKGTEHADENQ